jgi:hypothetical protein
LRRISEVVYEVAAIVSRKRQVFGSNLSEAEFMQ